MRSTRSQCFLVLAVLVVCASAAQRDAVAFSLPSFLQGSFVVTKNVVSERTGELLMDSQLQQFNITLGDNLHEMVLMETDPRTGNQLFRDHQIILSFTSNTTMNVIRFAPGAEEEMVTLARVNLEDLIKSEFYVSERDQRVVIRRTHPE